MLIKKEKLAKSRVRLTISGTAEHFREAFDAVVQDVTKDVKIEGFRPGKAPKNKVIEKVGRQYLEAQALDKALSKVYFEIASEEKIFPTEQANIAITEFTAPGEEDADEKVIFTFTAETDVIPEVKIDGYKKIKVKTTSVPEVTDEEVTKVVDYLRKQQAKAKDVEEGVTAKMGMWADIAYEGSSGGVKREDMANKNHPIVIGEGQLIPGFEEKLIGMKVGESKTFNVPFPKDYHAKELAGKKAEFTVTINELKEVELPELNEEMAKQFGHDSVEKLTAAIKENLVEEKKEQHQRELEEKVLEQLLRISKFEAPQSLIEQEIDRLIADAKHKLSHSNIEWNTYLAQTKQTDDQIREQFSEQATKNVKVGLILGKVIQEEEIKDEENGGRVAMDRMIDIATGADSKK